MDRLRERDAAARPQSADEVIQLLEGIAAELGDPPAKWSAKKKAELLLQVLAGQADAADVCERHRIEQADFDRWKQAFVEAGTRALGAGT